MTKNQPIRILAAVALAFGVTATSKFPSFSEATAMGAIGFEHSNSSYQATSRFGEGKANALTKLSLLGKMQPDDDGYNPAPENFVAHAKCGARQDAGGQKGDRRIFQFPPGKGKKTVKIYYDMLRIPDKIQVLYQGKEIFNSGFVSYRHTKVLTFNESPKEITVVITGNPQNSGTLWLYTVYCPT